MPIIWYQFLAVQTSNIGKQEDRLKKVLYSIFGNGALKTFWCYSFSNGNGYKSAKKVSHYIVMKCSGN